MTTIHIPPGAGRSHPMIDGDHVAECAVHDAEGAFEVVGESLEAILAVTRRHGVRLAGALAPCASR